MRIPERYQETDYGKYHQVSLSPAQVGRHAALGRGVGPGSSDLRSGNRPPHGSGRTGKPGRRSVAPTFLKPLGTSRRGVCSCSTRPPPLSRRWRQPETPHPRAFGMPFPAQRSRQTDRSWHTLAIVRRRHQDAPPRLLSRTASENNSTHFNGCVAKVCRDLVPRSTVGNDHSYTVGHDGAQLLEAAPLSRPPAKRTTRPEKPWSDFTAAPTLVALESS